MSSYIPIASTTLGSNQDSVTFSSIPTTLNGKTLRDLVLVFRGSATGDDTILFRLNNDSGSNYFNVSMIGTGTSAASGTSTSSAVNHSTGASGMGLYQVFDYAQTNKHKSVLSRYDAASERTSAVASRWQSTAAVTSVVVSSIAGAQLVAGSTFSLYGIEG